jgi:hypothetical protein
MKKTVLFAVTAILFAAVAFTFGVGNAGPGESAWFDMQGCAFCKNLVKDPALMKNMTWEHYDISNGAVVITTVTPEAKKSYIEAKTAMMDIGKKLETGQLTMDKVPMCGHCQAYGKLMMMGAKIESVEGSQADVIIMTSDKPEVVKEIKAFAQKNRDEMAKMEQAEKAHAH